MASIINNSNIGKGVNIMIKCNGMDRDDFIHEQVMRIVKENMEFTNVACPKATKASASASSTGETVKDPKASSATQGSWDSTNTPGGVSAIAKEKWNVQEIAAMVTKVLVQNGIEFSNKPLPEPTTISASTQPAWKTGEEEVPKMSASTQAVWKKDEPRKPSASTQAGWK